MKMKKIKKQLNYQPSGLTADQMENPVRLMSYFFADFPIHETRDNLWELYKAWIYHSAAYRDEDLTKNMMCFYTQFLEMVNACYIYAEMTKPKKMIDETN